MSFALITFTFDEEFTSNAAGGVAEGCVSWVRDAVFPAVSVPREGQRIIFCEQELLVVSTVLDLDHRAAAVLRVRLREAHNSGPRSVPDTDTFERDLGCMLNSGWCIPPTFGGNWCTWYTQAKFEWPEVVKNMQAATRSLCLLRNATA